MPRRKTVRKAERDPKWIALVRAAEPYCCVDMVRHGRVRKPYNYEVWTCETPDDYKVKRCRTLAEVREAINEFAGKQVV